MTTLKSSLSLEKVRSEPEIINKAANYAPDTSFLVLVVVLVAITTFTCTVLGKLFVDRFLTTSTHQVSNASDRGSRGRSSRRLFYSMRAVNPRRGAVRAHVVEEGTFGRLGIDAANDIGHMAQRLEDQHLSPMQQTPPFDFANNIGYEHNVNATDSVFYPNNNNNNDLNLFSFGAPMGRLELKTSAHTTSASLPPGPIKPASNNVNSNNNVNNNINVNNNNNNVNSNNNVNNNNNNLGFEPGNVSKLVLEKRPLLSSAELDQDRETPVKSQQQHVQRGERGAPGSTSPFVNKGEQHVQTPKVMVDVYEDSLSSSKKAETSLSRRMSAPVRFQSELMFASFALDARRDFCPHCGHRIDLNDFGTISEKEEDDEKDRNEDPENN